MSQQPWQVAETIAAGIEPKSPVPPYIEVKTKRQALHWAAQIARGMFPPPAEEPAPPRVYPDEMTPQLEDVLELMNFRTVPIAHALRTGGADIPRKTEAEQAFVLHWMIKLAIDHPEDWHKRVGARLQEIADAAKAKEATP